MAAYPVAVTRDNQQTMPLHRLYTMAEPLIRQQMADAQMVPVGNPLVRPPVPRGVPYAVDAMDAEDVQTSTSSSEEEVEVNVELEDDASSAHEPPSPGPARMTIPTPPPSPLPSSPPPSPLRPVPRVTRSAALLSAAQWEYTFSGEWGQ